MENPELGALLTQMEREGKVSFEMPNQDLSSLNSNEPETQVETTPPQTEAETQTPANPLTENPFQQKEEEYQRRIQEYEEKVSKLKSEDEIFANESIKKLNELAKAGIDVNSEQFWKWQTIDLDKITPDTADGALTLKRLELQAEMPDLTPTEIERLLKRKFSNIMSGEYTPQDTEYQETLLDLQIEAKASRTKLRGIKEQVTLPKVDFQKQEAEQAAARKAYEQYLLQVKQEVNTFAEMPIRVDDRTEIKFSVDEDTKRYAEQAMVNHSTFLRDNYVNKEGVVDFPRLKADLTWLKNKDKISKLLIEQGISIGKESVVETLENSSVDVTKKKAEVVKSIEEQLAEHFANRKF